MSDLMRRIERTATFAWEQVARVGLSLIAVALTIVWWGIIICWCVTFALVWLLREVLPRRDSGRGAVGERHELAPVRED